MTTLTNIAIDVFIIFVAGLFYTHTGLKTWEAILLIVTARLSVSGVIALLTTKRG